MLLANHKDVKLDHIRRWRPQGWFGLKMWKIYTRNLHTLKNEVVYLHSHALCSHAHIYIRTHSPYCGSDPRSNMGSLDHSNPELKFGNKKIFIKFLV